jgi:hypothetical protein
MGDHRKSWVYHFVVRLGKNYRIVRTRMKYLMLPEALITVLPFTVLYPQYPSQPFLSHWETWHRFRADWKSDPESAFFKINVRYEVGCVWICRDNLGNFIDITASPIMADHRR